MRDTSLKMPFKRLQILIENDALSMCLFIADLAHIETFIYKIDYPYFLPLIQFVWDILVLKIKTFGLVTIQTIYQCMYFLLLFPTFVKCPVEAVDFIHEHHVIIDAGYCAHQLILWMGSTVINYVNL